MFFVGTDIDIFPLRNQEKLRQKLEKSFFSLLNIILWRVGGVEVERVKYSEQVQKDYMSFSHPISAKTGASRLHVMTPPTRQLLFL
jgi:hypothetical protein